MEFADINKNCEDLSIMSFLLYTKLQLKSEGACKSSLFTCGELRQVLLLLGWIPKEQDALEADGLVGTQSDSNTEVVTANNLNQPGILLDRG